MARDRTLNPHSFVYGGLHYYLTLGITLPSYLVSTVFTSDQLVHKTVVYIAARSVTALLGAGCVLLTFLLGRVLFNVTSGLIAALCLALTMGFVNIAHFATVDIPMLFWMLLSFVMAALVLRRGDRRFYVAAGLCAGLAAATKYVGGVALLSLVAAYLLQPGRRDHVGLLWGALASAAAFVAGNPSLLLWSCEFLEGFVIDNAFNTWFRQDPDAVPLVRPLLQLYEVLGPALALLVGAALIYAARLLLHREWWRSVALIGSMFVPYLLLINNVHYATIRHVLPLAPPLLLLVGKMMADLLAARNRLGTGAGVAAGLAAMLYSGAYSLSAGLQFTSDARIQAARWIDENVPIGSTVEITPYSPIVPADRFVVIRRPKRHVVDAAIETLGQSPVYRALHPLYDRYEPWAERVGLCAFRERHYVGWFEASLAKEDTLDFDRSLAGLERRRPDFLVVSSLYYSWFEHARPMVETALFADVLSGHSAYREVATFKYRWLPWLDPELEFVNPTIRIFRRQAETHAGQASSR